MIFTNVTMDKNRMYYMRASTNNQQYKRNVLMMTTTKCSEYILDEILFLFLLTVCIL